MSNTNPTASTLLNLTLPSPSTLPILLGHSNYTVWHSAIHPILTSHQLTSTLLSGSWTEPRPLDPMFSPITTQPAPDPNANSPVQVQAQAHAQALTAWDHANLAICRFIRGTLALNVLPFVRRYLDAKLLWDALVALYGEANEIAQAGGPGLERRSAASVGVSVGVGAGEGQWDSEKGKEKPGQIGGSGSGHEAERLGGTVVVAKETGREVDVVQDGKRKGTGMLWRYRTSRAERGS